MKCADCKWFSEYGTVTQRGELEGECRALPITRDGFPMCYGDDWCGSFESRAKRGRHKKETRADG